MKFILRTFSINLGALWVTSAIIPAFVINGGFRGLMIGTIAFMVANILLVPLLKVLLLPLNLLTVGFFAWLGNVLALYFLVTVVPSFKIMPYNFPGADLNGFIIPQISLSTFQTAIVVSFIIGFIIHFIHWLAK